MNLDKYNLTLRKKNEYESYVHNLVLDYYNNNMYKALTVGTNLQRHVH